MDESRVGNGRGVALEVAAENFFEGRTHGGQRDAVLGPCRSRQARFDGCQVEVYDLRVFAGVETCIEKAVGGSIGLGNCSLLVAAGHL